MAKPGGVLGESFQREEWRKEPGELSEWLLWRRPGRLMRYFRISCCESFSVACLDPVFKASVEFKILVSAFCMWSKFLH